MVRRALPVLATIAALTVAPTALAATQRYAAPDGTGTACTSAAACDIVQAVNFAGPGDEVILTGQDYGSMSAPLTTVVQASVSNLDVHGADGQPRPRIFTNALNGVDLEGSGVTARHFEVDQLANANNQHAFVFQGDQASDLVARNIGGGGGKACTLLFASTLTDSVCEATGANGTAIYPYRTNGSPGRPVSNSSAIRNVTAVASGMNGLGIITIGGPGADEDQNFTVTNTIIVVPSGQPAIEAFKQAGAARITIDHSNFGLQVTQGGGQILKGPGNQQLVGSPRFVAPGNYHEAPGSMTIDRGATNPLNGPIDFDGDPRSLGQGGTDIGADEFVPPPAAVTRAPGAVTTTTAVINGSVNPNTIATTYHFDYGTTTSYGASTAETSAGAGAANVPATEALSGLAPATRYHYRVVATSAGGTTAGADRTVTTQSIGGGGGPARFIGAIGLSPATFAAAPRGASTRAARRRRRAPIGTIVTFQLSAAATVRFTAERASPGRRAGRRCVKATRGNRSAHKCVRYRLLPGAFTVQAATGQTRFRFTGRLRNRKLPVGIYRLVAVASDAGGLRSAPSRTGFRIVRR